MAAAFAQPPPPTINSTMNFAKQPSPPQPQYVTSPIGQTPPSTNASPTNYYSHLHVKQLRQPRQPLYVPAALRPTDLNTRGKDVPGGPRAPDTPPDSKHGSFDSVKSASSQAAEDRVQRSGLLDEDMETLRGRLSRAVSDDLDEEEGAVSGMPSTAHWKPNETSPNCAICNITFTWYFRRHHCRRCGEVVCAAHSSHTVPLDHNARYHSAGTPSRACDLCAREWRVIKKLRHSRANSMAESQISSVSNSSNTNNNNNTKHNDNEDQRGSSSSSSSQDTATAASASGSKPALPIPRLQQRQLLEPEMRVGSMARSEGGMVWSTF